MFEEYENHVPSSPTVANLPKIEDTALLNVAIHSQPAASVRSISSINEEPEHSLEPWTLSGVVTEQNVDDILNLEVDRKSIRTITLVNASRRLSNRLQGFSALPDDSDVKNAAFPLTVKTNLVKSRFIGDGPRTAPVQGYRYVNSPFTPTFISAPAGTLSQHGAIMAPLQVLGSVPRTSRSRRRSLSYLNAVAASGSLNATIDKWRVMIENDQKTHNRLSKNDADLASVSGKYDQVSEIKNTQITTQKAHYDAMLLATDHDFLHSAAIREVFRNNSLLPTDCLLFEMPEFEGEQNEFRTARVEDAPVKCWCLPTAQQLAHPAPAWRLFHQTKCFVVAVVIAIALMFLILLLYSQHNVNSN